VAEWTAATGWRGLGVPAARLPIHDLLPRSSDSVVAATGLGIFGSIPGPGWEELNEGLLGRSTNHLAFDPIGGFVFSAGPRDVFRSAGRQMPWTSSRPPDIEAPSCAPDIYALDATRTPEGTAVYVRTYRAFEFRGCLGSSAIWKSMDAGSSWLEPGFPPGGLVVDLASQRIAYRNEFLCTVYIAPFCVEASQWIYGSENGGSTWELRHFRPAGGPSLLAVDPEQPDIVYGGETNRLVKSVDGARTWTDTSLSVTPGIVLVAPTVVLVVDRHQGFLYRSLDEGRTWEQTASLPPGPMQSLTVDPLDSGVVFAGTLSAGIFRSHDFGDTWIPDNEGLETRAVRDLAFDPTGRSLYAATDQGVFSRETRSPRIVSPR
jgi:hypothetical protein